MTEKRAADISAAEKWAAIDIGSNTVQLLVAESVDNRFRPYLHTLRTTRLGAGSNPGLLDTASIEDTLAALAEYQQILAGQHICRLRIVATSAVRDAANRQLLLKAAWERFGWPIEVLSGEDEARISFLGAAAPFLADNKEHMLLIDIGGSSSELIRWHQGYTEAASANVGAVRAQSQGWDAMKIESILQPIAQPQASDTQALCLGAGGTITTAAGLLLGCQSYQREHIEGYRLTLLQLEQLLEELRPLSQEQRCSYSPLLQRRGEIIYQGLLILRGFYRLLQLPELIVSGGGLPEGCLLDLQRSMG